MTSIKKLSYLKRESRCFNCKFILGVDELTVITNNSHRLCLSCGLEKLNLRLSILKDWSEEKERMKKEIKDYLNNKKNLKVANRYILEELEK